MVGQGKIRRGEVKKHFVFSESGSHSPKTFFCRAALISVLLSNVIVISVALLYPVQGKGGASKASRAQQMAKFAKKL